MILNGYDNLTTVEIVDLSSSTTVCDNLPNYPYAIRGTSGGLLDKKNPLVCGGISVQDITKMNLTDSFFLEEGNHLLCQ